MRVASAPLNAVGKRDAVTDTQEATIRYNPPYGLTDPEPSLGAEPYVNGDPSIARAGSIPPAATFEYPQREIVAVIQYAYSNGLRDQTATLCAAPTNIDLAQLLKAIYGIAGAQVQAVKSVFNTLEYVNTTRVSYYPVTGFTSSFATGTYVKKSATSKLLLRISSNSFSDNLHSLGAANSVIRVTINSVNYEAIMHINTTPLSAPAANAEFQITGLSAGSYAFSISFGRYDGVTWEAIINPTQADAAWLPVFTSTTLVFGEVEP